MMGQMRVHISKQYRKYFWISNVQAMAMLVHISKVFDEKKELAVREAKTQFAVFMFYIKHKRFQEKKRKALEDRTH